MVYVVYFPSDKKFTPEKLYIKHVFNLHFTLPETFHFFIYDCTWVPYILNADFRMLQTLW